MLLFLHHKDASFLCDFLLHHLKKTGQRHARYSETLSFPISCKAALLSVTGPGKGVELAMDVSTCSDLGERFCALALK